jgi:aminoacrylate hydrolase
MPIAKLFDIDLHYEVTGRGTPLILAAGLGGVGSFWQPQLSEFASNFLVITYDQRGTGSSTHFHGEYSVSQLADDLVGLMDHLGIERAHFVGHSTGGAIGQIIATRYPERLRRMVQYASWTKADAYFRLCFDMRKELLLNSGTAAYVRSTALFLMPNWWIRDNEHLLNEQIAATLATFPAADIMVNRIEAILGFDASRQLGLVRAPTLVICAKDDFLTPPYFSEELSRKIPDAVLHFMETGGHACSQTMPTEFNQVIMRFLVSDSDL